jgi:hypothetical protein
LCQQFYHFRFNLAVLLILVTVASHLISSASASPKPKAKAKTKYLAALKKTTHEEIMLGVKKYKKHISDTGKEKQFITMAKTWLEGECWQDEYEDNQQRKGTSYANIETEAQRRKRLENAGK